MLAEKAVSGEKAGMESIEELDQFLQEKIESEVTGDLTRGGQNREVVDG